MPSNPVCKFFASRDINDKRIVKERERPCRIAIGAFVNLVLNVFCLGDLALLNGNASLYSFAIFLRAADSVLDRTILIDNERNIETILEFPQDLFCSICFRILLACIVIVKRHNAICKIRIGHHPQFIRDAQSHKALLATGRKVDSLIKNLEFIVLFEVCKLCRTGSFRNFNRRRRRLRRIGTRRGLRVILYRRGRVFIILSGA